MRNSKSDKIVIQKSRYLKAINTINYLVYNYLKFFIKYKNQNFI